MTDNDPETHVEDFAYDDDDDRHSVLAWVIGALIVVGVLASIGIGGLLWVRHQLEPGKPGDDIAVTVPKGSSTKTIADRLDDADVIESSGFFQMYAQVKGTKPFLAGDYTFRKHASIASVVQQLQVGPQVSVTKLTIPEGFTLKQIAERVGQLPGRSSQRFLDATTSAKVRSKYEPEGTSSLEGLIFPDTYFIGVDDNEETLLKKMVTQFDKVADELGVSDAAAATGVTPYQAIIIASMIEREAKFDDERSVISGVIRNRMAIGMKLQIDATVVYALGGGAKRVTFKDYEVDSPYNTYKISGLPPTPIAAPGRASLSAALSPAVHSYLFYVVIDTEGHHAFSATAAEHQANIEQAVRNGAR